MVADPPTSRAEPVGEPVVRGDPAIAGAHAGRAERFDPEDAASLAAAVAVVRAFADGAERITDPLSTLRAAAACAALVDGAGSAGAGSAGAAAERAGVEASLLRRWARVHDLPASVRRAIARGDLAPAAAPHVARLSGTDRLLVAWVAVDHDLDVEAVEAIADSVLAGAAVVAALRERGVEAGEMRLLLPTATYRELRRRASLADRPPDGVVAEALDDWFDGRD